MKGDLCESLLDPVVAPAKGRNTWFQKDRPEIERGGLLLMAKVEEKIGDLRKWKRFRKGGRRKIAKVEEKVCALQERQRFRKSGIETLV